MRNHMTMKSTRAGRAKLVRSTIRLAFSSTLLLVAVVYLGSAELERRRMRGLTSVEGMVLNDATQKAVELRLSQSESLYQVAGLFLAALCGLVIAKKEDTRISLSDRPEVLMFLVASGSLLTSMVWHMFFVGRVAEAYRSVASLPSDDLQIPDVFRPMFSHLFVFQVRCLAYGFAASVLTLASAHLLKDK
jgi:hypothetical protein